MSTAQQVGLPITREVADAAAKMSEDIRSRQPKRVPSLADLDQMENEYAELHRRRDEAEGRARNIGLQIQGLETLLKSTKEAHEKMSKLVGIGTVSGLRARLDELTTRIDSITADIADWKPRHAGMLKLAESYVRLIGAFDVKTLERLRAERKLLKEAGTL
jgi:predicted  nucleic acid-binding Zn-ribbon protein